jgi:hypothetical protein
MSKLKTRAAIATITALAAITVAGPASADTNGAPVAMPITQPAQANKTWDNLTGTGSYFWWNVKQDAYLAALKA